MDMTIGALADPTRRSIFEMLAKGPQSVGSLSDRMPVSRPAVSQHLKVLSDAGLVEATQEGTRRIYTVRPQGLEELSHWLETMWDETLDRFVDAARKEHEMSTAMQTIEPVVKVRQVPISPAAAFRLFTEAIAEWWPMETHSISAEEGQSPSTVRFEAGVGGRVIETAEDGSECPWAEVIAWQPPNRFVLAWHPSREPKASSILEVTFLPNGNGTEVRLDHRGWEEFGEIGQRMREGYDLGWDVVLSPFETAAV